MSKRKKGNPWSNIKKKPGPKRIQFEFKEERKASLAESDKGSWFKQEYEEDEPKPKKVSASSLKLKAQSAEKSQDVEPTDSFIEISERSDSSEEESEETVFFEDFVVDFFRDLGTLTTLLVFDFVFLDCDLVVLGFFCDLLELDATLLLRFGILISSRRPVTRRQ